MWYTSNGFEIANICTTNNLFKKYISIKRISVVYTYYLISLSSSWSLKKSYYRLCNLYVTEFFFFNNKFLNNIYTKCNNDSNKSNIGTGFLQMKLKLIQQKLR